MTEIKELELSILAVRLATKDRSVINGGIVYFENIRAMEKETDDMFIRATVLYAPTDIESPSSKKK